MTVPTPTHQWRFFRAGGSDQVALACPVQGLEIDERTLRLMGSDGDVRIRVRSILLSPALRSLSVIVALSIAAPVVARAQGTTPPHTAADVRFMQGMIHHHAQAVTMVALVPTRSSRQDLKMLARRIDVSQVDEIEWMRNWLRDRDEPLADANSDAHAEHGGGALMPGMLSADAMAALERATGAEFDRLFLEGMIRHHEGAIVMVAQLFATPGAGQESMIFGFASDVDSDQRAEIARMRRLRSALGAR